MATKPSANLTEAELNSTDMDDDGTLNVEHYPVPDGGDISDPYLREVWNAAVSGLDAETPAALSMDSTGHEHKGKGKGGGQFTGSGSDGSASNIRQVTKKWLNKSATLPRKAVAYATNKAKKMYDKMESKYGPRWAKAIITVGIVTFPTPFTTGAVLAMCGAAHLSNKLFGKGAAMSADDKIDMEMAGKIGRKFIQELAESLESVELSIGGDDKEERLEMYQKERAEKKSTSAPTTKPL